MKNILIFLFLLIQNFELFGQDERPSFRKISGPERWWAITHPFVAIKAKKITKKALSATEWVMQDTTLDGDPSGGQVDAFRHAFWMALLAQKMCWRKALRLGQAHEKGNYCDFKKGKMENGQLPDSMASVMDLFNNKEGAAIGCRNPQMPEDSLRQVVISSILQGKMRIILKNPEGKALTCDGIPIVWEKYKGCWQIPTCLVNSNFIKGK